MTVPAHWQTWRINSSRVCALGLVSVGAHYVAPLPLAVSECIIPPAISQPDSCFTIRPPDLLPATPRQPASKRKREKGGEGGEQGEQGEGEHAGERASELTGEGEGGNERDFFPSFLPSLLPLSPWMA